MSGGREKDGSRREEKREMREGERKKDERVRG